jgi:MinD superfamily P-loop ATPase
MKKLLVLSGKGGTGKTTISAAFIWFSQARAFADCDVDAPNLHLIAKMDAVPEETAYYGSQKAVIQTETCIGCGRCEAYCRFDAIHKTNGMYTIDEYACEGCSVCEAICPQQAVELSDDVAGTLTLYTGDKIFSTATLKMGRGNSGKLVSAVKANLIQYAQKAELVIVDGSPGIGCPVIASISGMDLVLIVTEPSLSGLSDLARILKTTESFQTKAAVCINKFDVCPEQTAKIKEFCIDRGIPVVGYVPYDPAASIAVNAGKSLAETVCPARDALYDAYESTMDILKR